MSALATVTTRARLHARLRGYVSLAAHLLSVPRHLFAAEALRRGLRPNSRDGEMYTSTELRMREPDLDDYTSLELFVYRTLPEGWPGRRRGYQGGVAYLVMTTDDPGRAWFSLQRAPTFDLLPRLEQLVIADAYRHAVRQARSRASRQARQPATIRHPHGWIADAVRRVFMRRRR